MPAGWQPEMPLGRLYWRVSGLREKALQFVAPFLVQAPSSIKDAEDSEMGFAKLHVHGLLATAEIFRPDAEVEYLQQALAGPASGIGPEGVSCFRLSGQQEQIIGSFLRPSLEPRGQRSACRPDLLPGCTLRAFAE